MREHELQQQQVRARTRPAVARSVLDDVSTWWSGGETAERAPRPEAAVTKQDFEQSLALVYTPVTLAHDELFGKTPDVNVAGSAAAKLGPATAALQVLANSKKEPKNQAAMRAPVADIETARTTLQVLAAGEKAQTLWHAAILNAMSVIDSVMALPVGDGIEQRDHDLLEASVKPTVQRLQDKTAGAPYVDFEPKTYTEGNEALSALGALNIAQLKPAIAHVTKGVQAIKAFATTMDEQWNAAIASLEAAQQKLSQHSASYTEPEEAK
jgi:hypothetical protein